MTGRGCLFQQENRVKAGMLDSDRLRTCAAIVASLMALLGSAGQALAFDPLAGDYAKADPHDIRIVAYNTERNFVADSSRDAAFNRILVALQPDVISFEEIRLTVSSAALTARLNSILPIAGGGSWQLQPGKDDGTIHNVIASRYPLGLKANDTIPISSTRGVCMALVDLPNSDHAEDLYLLSVHLKCCGNAGGSEDVKRQRSADAIVNWMADARGVARPSGNNITLPANTPMVVLGDFNMVGGPQQENTFITGNIQSEGTFGPDVKDDWNNSDLTNLNPLDPFTGANFTWQSDGNYPSSNLDRMFYTDSVFIVANSFVLNTNTMTPAARTAAGLQASDTLPTSTSDHLPIVMDLRDPQCVTASQCDDGELCNGVEVCSAATCHTGPFPCPGAWCDQEVSACRAYGDGDFDADGDVDLFDYAGFQHCFGQPSTTAACFPAQMTGDFFDIDLTDFSDFAPMLSGP
jgi:endonuclease/exonuclease/phosphatase family metal-dependent hydrolase